MRKLISLFFLLSLSTWADIETEQERALQNLGEQDPNGVNCQEIMHLGGKRPLNENLPGLGESEEKEKETIDT